MSPQAFYTSHIIPSESAVLNLVSSHCELISAHQKYSIGMSLMMLAYSAAKLLEIGASRLVDDTELMKKTIDLVVPALVSRFGISAKKSYNFPDKLNFVALIFPS